MDDFPTTKCLQKYGKNKKLEKNMELKNVLLATTVTMEKRRKLSRLSYELSHNQQKRITSAELIRRAIDDLLEKYEDES